MQPPSVMKVIKRDGRREDVSFDKVLRRIQLLASGQHKNGTSFASSLDVDVIPVAQKVINEIKDGITTRELDEFAATTCASLVTDHPGYRVLAGRIIMSNHQKNTLGSFADTAKFLYQNKRVVRNRKGRILRVDSAPRLDARTYKTIIENRDAFEQMIDYNRDFYIDWFGFKTLERSYLLKANAGHMMVQERPQHMYMRVAVMMHGADLDKVQETYDLLSQQYLSHASPTLFNSGTPLQQLSSCFLLGMEDTLEGIYDALKKTALISKLAGGIGINVSDIRAKGSLIRKTGGESDGLVPMLKNFNDTARYVNQGGKRKGSIAVYLEPHHPDLQDFLNLRKTHGNAEMRCLDLFTALWISDLFMKRLMEALEKNAETPGSGDRVMWSFFCPDEAPGLTEVYGDEYEKLYLEYERDGLSKDEKPILEVWDWIMTSQKETGTPYMLYKDPVNHRNAQKNIGIIKNSNLCAEIVLVNDPRDETIAVCNLAAIPLGSYVADGKFDFDALGNSVRVAIQNLNRIIDLNYYPVEDCRKSNMRDRPVGLGIIGLYDSFVKMRYPYDSQEARDLNALIAECIYYHAIKTSMELAKVEGPYETYAGSPASKGKLQFDLWNEDRAKFGHEPVKLSGRWDWDALKADIKEHGLRNSTVTTVVPSASTSNIIGQNESMECITSNLYVRRVLSCDYRIVNKYLQSDLIERKLWTPELRQKLVRNRGSVQDIEEIPGELRELYKTAFEVKVIPYMNLSIDRSPFIDLTQSLNLFISNPTDEILTSAQIYAWQNRLKTGMYYLRRETVAKAQQFTVEPVKKIEKAETETESESDSKPDEEPPEPEDEDEVFICRRDDPNCAACQV